MVSKLMVTFHSKAVFWVELQERINQGSQIGIRNLFWIAEITCKDLVEHSLIIIGLEWSHPTSHLIENHTQSPKIRKGTRCCLL